FSGRIVPLFDTMLVQQGEGSGTPTESHYTPSPEAQSPSHTTPSSPSLPPVTTTSIPTVTSTETTPIRIVPLFDTMLIQQGEGSGTPTESHHTPSPEVTSSHPSTSSIPFPSIPTAPIPPVSQTGTTPIIQYTKRARIAQSSALPTIADEHVSLVRDDSQGEACPTDSGFIADQDMVTIAKSFTLPHDSAPRGTSPAAEEGSMQQPINELTAFCTSLQRQHLELLAKFQVQEEKGKGNSGGV
nr:hypothetical protein [Tanacetum cinerariifolium]